MTSLAAAILLSLATPAAPAPKTDTGLPNDLLELLPEDTAGVLVIDAPKTAKTAIGQSIVKLFDASQRPNQPIHFADLATEAEWIVLSEFLIDQAVGDFAMIVRLKKDSGYAKAMVDKAKADKQPTEEIGGRTIYRVFHPGFAYSRIDDHTLMFVLAAGNTPDEIKITLRAAFVVREKPGPSRELRKLIEDGGKDDRAIRIFAHHPKKLAHAAYLPLASFDVNREAVAALGDKIVQFRGGIRMGDVAEVELRFLTKDENAAKEFVKAYEVTDSGKDGFVKEFRLGAKVVRKAEEVIITAPLKQATLDLLNKKPNK